MSIITVKEYAKKVGKTKEAIFYQIKKGKLKAQKNSDNEWEIILEDKQTSKKGQNNQAKIQEQELINKIKLLSKELELKDELLKSKENIIKSQSETIKAEQRTNMSLVKTCEMLEQSKNTLLLENESIKKERKKGFFARLFSWS